MKIKTLTSCFFLAFAISSCIQDEALNSEAAIDGCTGADVQLANINANEKTVDVYVNKGADLTKQELKFTIPEGAIIRPNQPLSGDIGIIYDFSEGTREFTVTSEDGIYKAVYTINIKLTELPTSYHFERLLVANNTPYHILYEFAPSTSEGISKVLQWSSGNPGFALTGMAKNPLDYPTVEVGNGYNGNCAKLETRDTGSFGAMVKMYIAAGNLFIGNFDVSKALAGQEGALQATTFGFQFYKKPKALKGYYKYKAGSVYTEPEKDSKGNIIGQITVPNKKDRFNIYAIMYEADDNSFMLDGTNSRTSEKLVYMAEIKEEDALETDQWTEFNLPFESQNGKTIDPQKLRNGKYKLGIIFSSSIDGDFFKGAVGSTLYIDEVELVCEEE